MAKLTFDNTTSPGTPAAAKVNMWTDSTTKRVMATDDTGVHRGFLTKNASVVQQTGFAADTYLTGSNLIIPSSGMQVGQIYEWKVGIEKTAAGVALIAVNVRIGTNGTIADTSRAAPVQTVAQAATASATIMFVTVVVRSVSAAGVIVASMGFTGTQFGDGDRLVSAAFDNSALGGQNIGLSLNGGASAAYTIDSVSGYMTA